MTSGGFEVLPKVFQNQIVTVATGSGQAEIDDAQARTSLKMANPTVLSLSKAECE